MLADGIGDDGWIACEHPERVPDLDETWWHTTMGGTAPCRGCLIALEAALANGYGDRIAPDVQRDILGTS